MTYDSAKASPRANGAFMQNGYNNWHDPRMIKPCEGQTMQRLLFSIAVGMLLGVTAGFVTGWGFAPVRYVDSSLGLLAQAYQDEYTVMVATAYRHEGDLERATERLAELGQENVADWVVEVTERYISRGRSIADVTNLVALSEAFGRLTVLMEPYRIPPTPPGAP